MMLWWFFGIFIKKGRPIKPKQLSVCNLFLYDLFPPLHLKWCICGLCTGTHGITTVSEVSVKVGATVSIPCLYEPSLKNSVKYLCKGKFWISCDKIIATNSKSSSPEGMYTIADNPNQGVFTVTITSLEEGMQRYWCAVEVSFVDENTSFQLIVSEGECVLF